MRGLLKILPAVFVFVSGNAQTRVVLIEQFTNSGCPPCAAATPVLLSYVDANPSTVVAVAYHTSFPYSDSMYFENPAESTQRTNYYGVVGVPFTVMDGNVFNGNTATFNANISSQINNRAAVTSPYDIETVSLTLTGNQLSGSFKFTSGSASNTSDNLVAHLVVIEKNVLKSAYSGSPGANTETQYGYVMRKMMPGANGTNLMNKTINGKDTVPLTWTLSKIKNINEVRVVAFVQNTSTKEIYQARLFTPSIIVGLAENNMTLPGEWTISPNPASDEILLAFENPELISTVSILNQLGEIVYTQQVNTVVNMVNLAPGLQNGVYFLNVSTGLKSAVKKLIVVR